MSRETSRGKVSVRLLCEAFGVTRQALHKAGKQRSPVGQAPVRQQPWPSCEQLRDGIQDIIQQNPAWGVRKVWATLRLRGLRSGMKRVYAIMKSLGLCFAAAARKEKRHYGHVTVPESNRRWASDLTTAWTKQDGWVAVVPVIDCGDRFGLAISVTKSQEAHDVLLPIEQSLWQHFKQPKNVPFDLELRTDHGPQYTGSDCERLCVAWHVNHTFAPIGRPTGNAVAERFIQTIKEELIWTRDWESLEQLDTAIQQWLTKYNYHRPHQAIDWKTPAQRRQELLTPTPRLRAA